MPRLAAALRPGLHRADGSLQTIDQQRSAVQGHRPHELGVLGEEVLRRRSAIGGSVQIDLRVAESAKHVGQVGHRRDGRVPARICGKPPHTVGHVRPYDGRFGEVEAGSRAGTVEAIRAPGPALVDEDDVAALIHL